MNKKIIICTTQRSGSTMLADDLSLTEKLGSPREYLIKLKNLEVKSRNTVGDYLNIMKQQGSTPNGVFAIKIMAKQIESTNSILKKTILKGQIEQKKWSVFRNFFGDALWIRISRNYVLSQAKSRVIAKQSISYGRRRGEMWYEVNRKE